jgi:hypothetical protein
MFQGFDSRVADDVPQLAREYQGKQKCEREAVKGADDTAAQFLQVFHEGHAQHAVFFFVCWINDGRGWRRGRRTPDETGLRHHFHGWSGDNFG